MPAITVDDVTDLKRLPRVGESATVRPVRTVVTAPGGFEGEGFPVRRAFAGVDLTDLDPFIHMDQMGEVEYAPGEPKGTPWHPHRGFETVTYMLDGIFEHQDSNGGGGVITNPSASSPSTVAEAAEGCLIACSAPYTILDTARHTPSSWD